MNNLRIFSWVILIFGVFAVLLPLAWFAWANLLDISMPMKPAKQTNVYYTTYETITNEIIKERIVINGDLSCTEVINNQNKKRIICEGDVNGQTRAVV